MPARCTASRSPPRIIVPRGSSFGGWTSSALAEHVEGDDLILRLMLVPDSPGVTDLPQGIGRLQQKRVAVRGARRPASMPATFQALDVAAKMAFLNIEAKLRETVIDGAPLMSFVRAVRHVAVDRVFLLFDAALKARMPRAGDFAGAPGHGAPKAFPDLPGHPDSWKHTRFAEGNVQLSFSKDAVPFPARGPLIAGAFRRRGHRSRTGTRAREGMAREQRVPARPQDQSGAGVRAALRAGDSFRATRCDPAPRRRVARLPPLDADARRPSATRSASRAASRGDASLRRRLSPARPDGNRKKSGRSEEHMPIQLNSPGWTIRRARTSRGAARDVAGDLPGLPSEFLTDRVAGCRGSHPGPPSATRGREAGSAGLDLSYDLAPGQTAILAIRHPSGALTFHLPVQSTSRGMRGPSRVRFQVTVRQNATRGVIGQAVKAIVIKVVQVAADKAASLLLPKLAEAFEKSVVEKARTQGGVAEGHKRHAGCRRARIGQTGFTRALAPVHPRNVFERRLRVSRRWPIPVFSIASRTPTPIVFSPSTTSASAERLNRTPACCSAVCRNRARRSTSSPILAAVSSSATSWSARTSSAISRRRFKLGRAVLVASPNEGTPLATPKRWDETVGWLANLLELFPDNPFTTGAAFVANGLVWLANHASGDLPGLSSMDGEGDLISGDSGSTGSALRRVLGVGRQLPADGRRSLHRLLDVGIDQLFGICQRPGRSFGGRMARRSLERRVHSGLADRLLRAGRQPAGRFRHPRRAFSRTPRRSTFSSTRCSAGQQPLKRVDPRKGLPDRRLLRGAVADAAGSPSAADRDDAPAAGGAAAHLDESAGRRAAAHHRDQRRSDVRARGAAARSLSLDAADRHRRRHGQVDRRRDGAFARDGHLSVLRSARIRSSSTRARLSSEAASCRAPRRSSSSAWAKRESSRRRAWRIACVRRSSPGRSAWPRTRGTDPAFFELATTLIGSGGTGVTPGEAAAPDCPGSARSERAPEDEHGPDGKWPRVSHLHFIELYLDRATEAWRSLRMQEAATPGRYDNRRQR